MRVQILGKEKKNQNPLPTKAKMISFKKKLTSDEESIKYKFFDYQRAREI